MDTLKMGTDVGRYSYIGGRSGTGVQYKTGTDVSRPLGISKDGYGRQAAFISPWTGEKEPLR